MADRSLLQPPWHLLTAAADGRPVAVAAASGDRLLVASIAANGDLLVPTLARAIAISLAPEPHPRGADIVPIPDRQTPACTRAHATRQNGQLLMPTLARAIAIRLAPDPDLRGPDIVPIPDRQLRAWTRAP